MMFQRALPDVEGLGVITSTLGLIRSSHPVMCFGLPLRTTRTTTESVTMPLYWLAAHDFETIPALTRRGTSGAVEKATTPAARPEATARLCAPEAPTDGRNPTPLPPAACAKAEASAWYA